jgi:hypothetical protein
MQFQLSIDCDNAAFEDSSELARILRSLANKFDGLDVTDVSGSTLVKDINGNTVGKVEFIED